MRRALLAATLAVPLVASGAPGSPRLAVWSVKALPGVAEQSTAVLPDLIAAQVAKAGRFQVLSASDVAAVLGFEKQRQALGCVESSCLAEIGGALNVQYMLSGQLGILGTRYHLTLVLVDPAKALPVARASQFCEANDDALAGAVLAAVEELGASMPTGKTAAAGESGVDLVARADAARRDRPAEAAGLYDEYLRRFPEGDERCVAMLMSGASWDAARAAGKAADRFLAFAREVGCVARAPDSAARALDRAGSLCEQLGRSDDAKGAWTALATLTGVRDPSLRAKVEQAKMRVRLAEGEPR